MKTTYKILLSMCVGICLICAGISIGGANQIHSLPFIQNLDLRIQANRISNFEQDVGYIRSLKIDITKANVTIHEDATRTSVKVKATNVYDGFKVKQDNDVLVIKQPHYWFKRINSHISQIDIFIPKGYTFDTIKLDAGTGKSSIYNLNARDIQINTGMGDVYFQNIKCQTLDLDTGMANTVIRDIECQEKMKLDAGMGNLTIDVIGCKKDFDYKVDVGLGNVQIGNEKFSGIVDHKSYQQGKALIDIRCGMGNVELRMED